jgi:hypothetical protein
MAEQLYDSDEERYASWYFDELVEYHILNEYFYHPKPFPLSDRVAHECFEEKKTKTKHVEKFLMHPHNYQADFLLYWNPSWEGRFFMTLDGWLDLNYPFIANMSTKKVPYTVVDVKGSFAGKHNNSAVTFPLDQKWVYNKHKIYVQKIIPKDLFKETFIPRKYEITNVSGKKRKIAFKPKFIEQYIESLSNKKIISSLEFKPTEND